MKSLLRGGIVLVVALAAVVPFGAGVHGQAARYEVWIIDQADAARGGARLYIYEGQRLEAGALVTPGAITPEVVNLDAAARGVGDGPGVRPHMVEFNGTHSHAIIANVASGHVYIMRAGERRIVASIDVGEQAHHAMATPDDKLILVSNQNGKRLARIQADFAAERFTHNRNDDLNMGALEDASRPDNAPICPTISGGKAYVTLRGGGLYIVDYRATPMRVIRAYGRTEIAPLGCGGMAMGEMGMGQMGMASKVYINSGTATSSDLYVLDPASDAIMRHVRLSWTGADGHGMVATGGGRYLWMGNRGDHNIVVINTNRDAVVGILTGVGAAPDIMGISPSGRHVFVALRGPNNLTGGPSAKGETPGLAVFEVTDEGRGGRRIAFLPIGDQSAGSVVDPHTLAVRIIR